jgi:hypothetical protein
MRDVWRWPLRRIGLAGKSTEKSQLDNSVVVAVIIWFQYSAVVSIWIIILFFRFLTNSFLYVVAICLLFLFIITRISLVVSASIYIDIHTYIHYWFSYLIFPIIVDIFTVLYSEQFSSRL